MFGYHFELPEKSLKSFRFSMNLLDCSNGKGGKHGVSRTRKREEWYTSTLILLL